MFVVVVVVDVACCVGCDVVIVVLGVCVVIFGVCGDCVCIVVFR